MPNLSPAQLAEGARLMAAHWCTSVQEDVYSEHEAAEAKQDFEKWLREHFIALLAAAQRVAVVKSNLSMQDAAVMCMESDGAHWLSKHLEAVRDLAARHNIDLSEPTIEPPRGQQKGGDCHAASG